MRDRIKDCANMQMVRLGMESDNEKNEYERDKINVNKLISRLFSEASKNAKSEKCIVCGKKCSSFCNSHSTPKFTLKRVAKNGEVATPLQKELPTLEKNFGVGKAGTFHLICKECDGKVFQEYENLDAYLNLPTDRMLAQIALKNYLLMISRRNEERELYKLLGERYPQYKDFADEKIYIGDYDLRDYHERLKYAMHALNTGSKKSGKKYYLCYHTILDYVVPYASQALVTMISDFEDNIINNVYNFDIEYRMRGIHFAIFPLEKTSAIFVFVEEGEKSYRKFYRQLKKLEDEDILAAINYILFSYNENIFLHPDYLHEIKENEKFMDICRKTTDFTSSLFFADEDPIKAAIKEFSLQRRNEIPNLLGRGYSLNSLVSM